MIIWVLGSKRIARPVLSIAVWIGLYATVVCAQWVPVSVGGTITGGAIVGGFEDNKFLYVCRGTYAGGIHSGKVVAGKCNVAAEGKEVVLSSYEVLRGRAHWDDSSRGTKEAIVGGHVNGQPVYLCRAELTVPGPNGISRDLGIHPGKVVGGRCRFGYGGEEKSADKFEIAYNYGLAIMPEANTDVRLVNETGKMVFVVYRISYINEMSPDCTNMSFRIRRLYPREVFNLAMQKGGAAWFRIMNEKVKAFQASEGDASVRGCSAETLLFEQRLITNSVAKKVTIPLRMP